MVIKAIMIIAAIMIITAIRAITAIWVIKAISAIHCKKSHKRQYSFQSNQRMFNHYNIVFITANMAITPVMATAAIMTISISGIINKISDVATIIIFEAITLTLIQSHCGYYSNCCHNIHFGHLSYYGHQSNYRPFQTVKSFNLSTIIAIIVNH